MSNWKVYRCKFLTLMALIIIPFFVILLFFKKNLIRYKELKEIIQNKAKKEEYIVQKSNDLHNEELAARPLDNFYKLWKPHLSNQADAILSDWDFLSNKIGLFTIRKEIIVSRHSLSTPQIQITLEGAPMKIFSWLGQIEEKYPLVRLDMTKITASENNVQIEILASLANF